MKILFLTKYSRIGASSRVRTLQYIPYFEAHGYHCTVRSLLDDEYLQTLYETGSRAPLRTASLYLRRLSDLLGVYRYDLVWLEKELFPYLPGVFEKLLPLLGKAYIADYDDAVFHNYDGSGNPLVRRILGRKIDAVMRGAACVVAGNEYLAARARAAGASRVELIPTVVDQDRYAKGVAPSGAQAIIGWIGSPSTQFILARINGALAQVCKAHNARLLLVGATAQAAEYFPGVDVEIQQWSEDNEATQLRRMDVGVMPLIDLPFHRGKCGYKLIQYMACSVPVVASPIGVNTKIVNENRCGLLADSQTGWELALMELLDSPQQRAAMGAAGRKAVEEYYSLQVQAPVLAGIIQDLAQGERT